MDLKTYISETMYSILKAIQDADNKLEKEGLGGVWRTDFITHSQALINVRIAKGIDPSKPGKSQPVLILDYDVNITVEDTTKSGDSAEIGVKAKLLSIFSFQGKVEGQSEKSLLEKSIQNLKFSIPIAITPQKGSIDAAVIGKESK